jgi:hypothetical protein
VVLEAEYFAQATLLLPQDRASCYKLAKQQFQATLHKQQHTVGCLVLLLLSGFLLLKKPSDCSVPAIV